MLIGKEIINRTIFFLSLCYPHYFVYDRWIHKILKKEEIMPNNESIDLKDGLFLSENNGAFFVAKNGYGNGHSYGDETGNGLGNGEVTFPYGEGYGFGGDGCLNNFALLCGDGIGYGNGKGEVAGVNDV